MTTGNSSKVECDGRTDERTERQRPTTHINLVPHFLDIILNSPADMCRLILCTTMTTSQTCATFHAQAGEERVGRHVNVTTCRTIYTIRWWRMRIRQRSSNEEEWERKAMIPFEFIACTFPFQNQNHEHSVSNQCTGETYSHENSLINHLARRESPHF